LVESALRPEGVTTKAADDYPVALSDENLEGLLVWEENGRLDACLASLVRPYLTSLGELPVGAIGSVVTHPAWRGRGLSSRLQVAALDDLRKRGAALAVLWSDRPKLYEGRGFRPAGVEYHVDLTDWRPSEYGQTQIWVRPFTLEDTPSISRLYGLHPWRTRRPPCDDARLYGMPGTQGFVATDRQSDVVAYVFCGKGADFPQYVLEWGGEPDALGLLLLKVKAEGWATMLLAPQGAEATLTRLTGEGAAWQARPSGLWTVLNPELLCRLAAAKSAGLSAAQLQNPATWLGKVTEAGHLQEGIYRLAVWGFDSI
jgi:GNAT superfamily N-acetyltransferase